jgi:hypothetical protein
MRLRHTLLCAAGSFLLWTVTFPLDSRVVPQGMEVVEEVCLFPAYPEYSMPVQVELTTRYLLLGQQIGERSKSESYCVDVDGKVQNTVWLCRTNRAKGEPPTPDPSEADMDR